MGLSTFVLAAVSIFATKATSKFATYYYQSTVCRVVDTNCGATTGTCTLKIGAAQVNYTIFTTRSGNGLTCSNAAKKS